MLSAESTDKKITQKCEIWARPAEQILPRVRIFQVDNNSSGLPDGLALDLRNNF